MCARACAIACTPLEAGQGVWWRPCVASLIVTNNVLGSLQVLRIQPLHRGGDLPDRLNDKIFMGFQRLTALRELELRRCAEITDDGLRSYYTFQRDTELASPTWDISEGRARLGQDVKVTLVDCDGITPGCIQELRERYPGINLRKTSDDEIA